jgi:hypothetical protein
VAVRSLASWSPVLGVPAQRTGELLVRVAAGDADVLSGRFLHAEDDLDELLADAGRVVAEDLLTLRLRKWPEG